MNVFVQSVAGKTTSYSVDKTTTVRCLKDMIAEREGMGKDSFRVIFGGKDLCDDKLTLADYNVQKNSTIMVVFRLQGGGQVDPDTLWELLASELPTALEATKHVVATCALCTNDDLPCIKACCTHLCDQCATHTLKSNKFTFECLICKKTPELTEVVTYPDIAPLSAAYREILNLLKHVDMQMCECGAVCVNETLVSKQQCLVCKRTFCFFCRKSWDPKTMSLNRYACNQECHYANLLTFELVEFVYSQEGSKKIPNRRLCPKCFAPGGYDGKCKYHKCNECKHAFCFLCLKSEAQCKAGGSSWGNTNCVEGGEPVKQTYRDLPRFLA